MKVVKNKIVEATEEELFAHYLKHGWDDIMSFTDFLVVMKNRGCKVIMKEKK